jgi:Holliday junction resolvasome RuvABC endonuclease subunit
MRLLALDQASRVTGVAIFNDDKLVKYGTFEIKSNQELGKRLTQFLENLDKLYAAYHFDAVAYEDIQLQMGNVETYKKLAYIQAMILFWCEKHEKNLYCLSPSHWRKVLKDKYGMSWGRKRAEQKQTAIDFIQEHYKKEVDSDTADAICIGCAANIEINKTESAF